MLVLCSLYLIIPPLISLPIPFDLFGAHRICSRKKYQFCNLNRGTQNYILIQKKLIQKGSADKIIIPYKEIEKLFNSICKSLPKIRELTEKRKTRIRCRWLKYKSVEVFRELFTKTEASDFLSGRSGEWNNCSFDWLINENNMIKVLEGNYANKKEKYNGYQVYNKDD